MAKIKIKRSKEFHSLQNKFRGVFSQLRSTTFNRSNILSPHQKMTTGLSKLMLLARISLSPIEYSPFISWVKQQSRILTTNKYTNFISYDSLRGVATEFPPITLEKEILWIIERIKLESETINAFRQQALLIEKLIFEEKFDEATEVLHSIELKHGGSFWSIQLNLSLQSLLNGLEGQKAYAAKLRGIFRGGLLSFITYNTSISNEEKTTFNKYIEDVTDRIEQHRYFESFVKTYALYRLANKWPTTLAGFADILNVEQSHSLIDIYETFIAVVQKLIEQKYFVSMGDYLLKALHELEKVEINDFRINKIVTILNKEKTTFNTLPDRDTSIADMLIGNNPKNAIKLASNYIKNTSLIDPWPLIYSGFAYSLIKDKSVDRRIKPSNVAQMIGVVLSRQDLTGEIVPQLLKMLYNLRSCATFVALIDFLKIIYRPDPLNKWETCYVGLNSPTYGVEDIPLNFIFSENFKHIKNTPIKTVWETQEINFSSPVQFAFKQQVLIKIFLIIKHLTQCNEELALSVFNSLPSILETPKSLQVIRQQLTLSLYSHLNLKEEIISFVADVSIQDFTYKQLIGIEEALQHHDFNDYKNLSHTLSASIARDLYVKYIRNITQKDYLPIQSQIRFLIKQFLKKNNYQKPSDILDDYTQYEQHQLIYFLNDVCVPSKIAELRSINGSRALREERLKICNGLLQLDNDGYNRDKYLEEITSITNQQLLEDGQRIVDSTRIHVDTENLKKYLSSKLSEDYARYQDLRPINLQETLDLQNIQEEIKHLKHYSDDDIYKPKNEADIILFQIIQKIIDEFLTNPNFGLDFYLSTRIRHQSFIGRIRNIIEASKLITVRDTESKNYKPNDHWLNLLTIKLEDELLLVNRSFSEFANNIDSILLRAKDDFFQIQSKEKPDGLIYIKLLAHIIIVSRAYTRSYTPLSEFLDIVISLLWGALAHSLEKTRQYISNELKSIIDTEFSKLRLKIKTISSTQQSLLAFDMEIGKCATDVQRALDEIAVWFMRSESNASSQTIMLNKIVDVSIDAALKSLPSFEPNIVKIIDEDLAFQATDFTTINDILFIALGNVSKHSGLKKPKVSIRAFLNKEKEVFSIQVSSDTDKIVRQEKEPALAEIRTLIQQKEVGQKTRFEGRSGFFKIAAVVLQSDKGNIDFKFETSDVFLLSVDFAFIPQSEIL